MLLVDSIRKDFGSVHAVCSVSFSIADGTTFGLLGPNGAGKTTTMRMILGILTPDGGEMTWNGRYIDARTRHRFGYLPEERGLYGRMGVRDHIRYFGRLRGVAEPEISRRTAEWIERLGLQEYAGRPCAELSKGNQQKVQLACAAVHDPELLILDEPFSGLDPVNAEMLLALLEELRRNGTTLVLSSHEMWQVERLCTDFCIIAQGRNLAAGTLADLRRGWPARRVRIAPGTPPVLRILEAIDGARQIERDDATVTFDLPVSRDGAALLRSLVAAESITAFEPLEPSLRDLYLRIIGDSRE
ncbi:MAG TPA: ATP-binding cassette domain-containing protein [Candidatus Tyrphobacter sp.]